MHLGWQGGFLVGSQESIVDNVCLSSMHRKSDTVVDHLQAKYASGMVSKEEQIQQKLHGFC